MGNELAVKLQEKHSVDMDDDATGDWLAQRTKLCNRYQVFLTQDACDRNRSNAENVHLLKCANCRGLDDQCQKSKPSESSEPHQQSSQPEVLDPSLVYPDVDEEELDDLLSELFPAVSEEQDDEQLKRALRRMRKPRQRKIAVYRGRCRKCGGYMAGDLEGQFADRDEEAHRCINCGWRTSPQYEWNRSANVNTDQKRS